MRRGRSDVAHIHLRDHGHADQVREARRLQFLHDPRTVYLDGARADAEFAGDDLVGTASGEPLEDLTLPRGEPIQPPAHVEASRLAAQRLLAQCQSLRDAVENGAVRKRLFDEVDGARP